MASGVDAGAANGERVPESPMRTMAAGAALWFEAARSATRLAARGACRESEVDPDPVHLAPAARELAFALARDPAKLAAAAGALWARHAQLAAHGLARQLGSESAPVIEPAATDLRFRDPAWSRSPFYNHLMQAYLLNATWIAELAEGAELPDAGTRRKVAFSTRIFTETLSPTNVPWLNPAVERTALERYGRNLVEGMRNWLRDTDGAGKGPAISQVDDAAFEVGETVATAPGKVVWRNDLLELIQYAPTTDKVRAVPTLFVPPWINKYYILDLVPRKSMVRWLVDRGHTVFLISWVNPDERHRNVGLEDMLEDGLLAAADKVLEESGADSLNLVGYCIGGTLSGVALAHLARERKNLVNSCTFFASQFDFSDAGDLMALTDSKTVDRLCEKMRRIGYLPSSAMSGSFNLLRPADLLWSFAVNNYLLGLEPGRFDLLFWNADSTRMAARLHEEYLRGFYVENRLARGELRIAGSAVSLEEVDVPTYHVVGKEDHIAPAESVYRGMRLLGGDKRFVLADSGHIAGIINPPRARKYGYRIDGDPDAPDAAGWAETATAAKGSWWSDWIKWLNRHSRKRVEAREPGATLGTLEEAPGQYVCTRYRD